MKFFYFIAFIFLTAVNCYPQWTLQYEITDFQPPDDVCLYSIFFIDENKGIAVGSNCSLTQKIFMTTDGGNYWFMTFLSNYFNGGFKSVWFPTATTGIAVGSYGAIFKSTDAGNNWYPQNSGTEKLLNSIFFIDENIGWIVGGYNTENVIILKTTDRGESWNSKVCAEMGILQDVRFLSHEVGWAVGYQQTGQYPNNSYRPISIITTNGGESWQSLNVGVTDCQLHSVYFANLNIGWITGTSDYYGERKAAIIKTTDGGFTWIPQINDHQGILYSIRMCDENSGWAVGYQNLIGLNYETKDGGNTWSYITSLEDIRMQNIFMLNSTIGWGVRRNIIFKYDIGTNVKEYNSSSDYFVLNQNYPNPFNPITKIKYSVPRHGGQAVKTGHAPSLQLIVYDILGNEITTLVNEPKAPGTYEVEFSPASVDRELSSGIYFYRLEAGSYSDVRKMLLLK